MKNLRFLTKRPIAHRGYHNKKTHSIENSLSAFSAAIDKGFAIELDVQITKDGRAAVFHDESLERLTDKVGTVDSYSMLELEKITLSGSKDKITSLETVLSLVDGKVPVIIEMKKHKHAQKIIQLAKAVVKAQNSYSGKSAAMSFSHDLILHYKSLTQSHPIGLVAQGSKTSDYLEHSQLLKLPIDFVSYNINDIPNQFITDIRIKNIPVITWTVNTLEKYRHANKHTDQVTFEGFDPDLA